MYNLIDTDNQAVIKSNIDLDKNEANVLNYAYALNNNKKRYVKTKKNRYMAEQTELNLFQYQHPI